MTTTVAPVVALPEAARVTGADKRDKRRHLFQVVLFATGSLLLPLGLAVIGLGWYGAASTPYLYDQVSYLVSGGLGGLGLTFVGGFLYFGAWLARIAADQRESQRRLADTLLALAEAVARSDGQPMATNAEVVVAGAGTTAHRRDCHLIGHRSDLTVVTAEYRNLTDCRICRPRSGQV